MVDILCRYCGEPWDLAELHDMPAADWEARPFLQASRRFVILGCTAWDLEDDPDPCAREPLYSRAQLEGLVLVLEQAGGDLEAYAADAPIALAMMEGTDA